MDSMTEAQLRELLRQLDKIEQRYRDLETQVRIVAALQKGGASLD